MTKNTAGDPTPTSGELLSAYEQLPTADKLAIFEELVCILSDDLSRFDDPDLQHQTDILDGIVMNIGGRLEEIKAVYGLE